MIFVHLRNCTIVKIVISGDCPNGGYRLQDLTEAGAYPQLPTQPNCFDHFQTYTASYYGHSELSREEKSKFEFEEKKVQFITESLISSK